MKIAVGCDHGGFEHKNAILEHLKNRGFEVVDCGIYENKSVDYPDVAVKVCEQITSGNCERGILVCGTGIGMSMAANRNPKIRAALCTTVYFAELARRHNDANVLVLPGRYMNKDGVLFFVQRLKRMLIVSGRWWMYKGNPLKM